MARKDKKGEIVEERILYCLQPENALRHVARWMELSRVFRWVIELSIIGSSIFVLMTPPADDIPGYDHPMDPDTMRIINTVFVAVFT
eukprot:2530735-Rhodomonas_salina.1